MLKNDNLQTVPLSTATWRRLEIAGGVSWRAADKAKFEDALQRLRDSQSVHSDDMPSGRTRKVLTTLEADLGRTRFKMESALSHPAIMRHLRWVARDNVSALNALNGAQEMCDDVALIEGVVSKALAGLEGKEGAPSDAVVNGFLYVCHDYYGCIEGAQPYGERGWAFLSCAYEIATGRQIGVDALQKRITRSRKSVRDSLASASGQN